MIRVAINGYGRIGRSVLRALYESDARSAVTVVAINELADCKTIGHLTRYDSTHGRFPGTVEVADDQLTINGDSIAILHSEQIDQLPWGELDIDVVLECSGAFADRATAQQHIDAGANARAVFPARRVQCRCHHCLWHQPAYSDWRRNHYLQRLLLDQLCCASD